MKWYAPLLPLAQAVIDPNGSAGWAGAGLLGLVLGWLLLKHLPEKDRQAKEKDDAHAKTIQAIMDTHKAEILGLTDRYQTMNREQNEHHHTESLLSRTDFKENLEKVADHCEKTAEGVNTLLRRDVQDVGARLDALGKDMEALSHIIIQDKQD